ncbi:MAG TPA: DUF5915 domain-containing protein, partial [Anaerolineales bacterium]|nr:DUF5915 domain-containing protein [Anaerolineales bacterium]
VEIDAELRNEGLAREFVRRVQELRKQAGFAVEDRIHIQYASTLELGTAVEAFRDYITAETLALSLDPVEHPAGDAQEDFAFDAQRVRLGLSQANPEEA